jgi:hypothetical protein
MKSSFQLWLLFICFLVPRSLVLAQSSAPPQNPPARVPANIHQLFTDDQAERTVGGVLPKYGPDVNSRDASRRAEARLLLEVGELKTAQDFHDAAFIFQHGHSPQDYLLAHILAVEAIVKGDASSKWLAAATLDRYLQAVGQKQVFGTQYSSKGYMYLMLRRDDPNAANSPEAQQKGNTQEPYDRTLVPESLRAEFCVADQAAQATNLSDLNAGKPFTGTLPPGCND